MAPQKKFYRTENRFDPYLTKTAMSSYIEDILKGDPYKQEVFTFQNYKVCLGLVILVLVVISHYHYIPWPQDYYLLAACVIAYQILTKIYCDYEKNTEKDIFILYRDNNAKKTFGFAIQMELCNRKITLKIVDHPKGAQLVQEEIKANEYFDEKGFLDQQKTKSMVERMLMKSKEKE